MNEPPHVLVIDDDDEFLAYVRDGLAGFVVVGARTPMHAMWLLEHERFQAVVCDLVFGDVDGRHVLDLVRERWPAMARILVTGFGERLQSATMLPAVESVLHKPCDLAGLSQLLTDRAPS